MSLCIIWSKLHDVQSKSNSVWETYNLVSGIYIFGVLCTVMVFMSCIWASLPAHQFATAKNLLQGFKFNMDKPFRNVLRKFFQMTKFLLCTNTYICTSSHTSFPTYSHTHPILTCTLTSLRTSLHTIHTIHTIHTTHTFHAYIPLHTIIYHCFTLQYITYIHTYIWSKKFFKKLKDNNLSQYPSECYAKNCYVCSQEIEAYAMKQIYSCHHLKS